MVAFASPIVHTKYTSCKSCCVCCLLACLRAAILLVWKSLAPQFFGLSTNPIDVILKYQVFRVIFIHDRSKMVKNNEETILQEQQGKNSRTTTTNARSRQILFQGPSVGCGGREPNFGIAAAEWRPRPRRLTHRSPRIFVPLAP